MISLQDRLEAVGINIRLYYWIREGEGNDVEFPKLENADDYSFEFFGLDDIELIAVTEERGDNRKRYRSWLAAGKKCFGVKYRGHIAAYNWIDCDEVNHPWMSRYRLKDNEAYLFHITTLKAFRGKRIAPHLRLESYKVLRSMGETTFYSLSNAFNTPAHKFKRRLNARTVLLGLYVQLFRKITWNWTIKKYAD